MAIHLFIVAKKRHFLDPFKTAYRRAKEVPDEFYVRTCPTPNQLLNVVREVVLLSGQPVGTLDIFGHGGPGFQKLGKKVLFGAIDTPEGDKLITGKLIAERLQPFLAKDARVRLLGCKTARKEDGRALLRALQNQLGSGVIVHGTIAYADAKIKPLRGNRDPGEFGERGFKVIKEEDWLYSSTEAMTGQLAPEQKTRIVANQEWFGSFESS